MESNNILVVDDEPEIADLVEVYLQSEGFRVYKCATGTQALAVVGSVPLDLAILDVMLPDISGFTLCGEIRKEHHFPVLMLTAKAEDMDKITGLTIGADDYMTKPFNPLELVARVKAQLRRTARRSGNVLTVRDLALDTASFQLTKRGEPILLTPMEYKILAMLMRSPGRIFTKIQLYEGAIGTYFEGDDNTMMVHISKLRDKLEDDPRHPQYIITVRGLGYKLEK